MGDKDRELLSALSKNWADGDLNFYGTLEAATQTSSAKVRRPAREKLKGIFGVRVGNKAITAWRRTHESDY